MAHVTRAAVVLSLASALCGCEKKEAPAPPLAAEPVKEAPATAASAFREGPFVLVASPSGEYTAGAQGQIRIDLSANGEFHVNDKYPFKWKAAESPGVTYAAPTLGRDAVALEPSRATLKVDFTPDAAGQKTVKGQLSFSVCSAEHCLVEKRDVALVVAVK